MWQIVKDVKSVEAGVSNDGRVIYAEIPEYHLIGTFPKTAINYFDSLMGGDVSCATHHHAVFARDENGYIWTVNPFLINSVVVDTFGLLQVESVPFGPGQCTPNIITQLPVDTR